MEGRRGDGKIKKRYRITAWIGAIFVSKFPVPHYPGKKSLYSSRESNLEVRQIMYHMTSTSGYKATI